MLLLTLKIRPMSAANDRYVTASIVTTKHFRAGIYTAFSICILMWHGLAAFTSRGCFLKAGVYRAYPLWGLDKALSRATDVGAFIQQPTRGYYELRLLNGLVHWLGNTSVNCNARIECVLSLQQLSDNVSFKSNLRSLLLISLFLILLR